MEWGRGKCSAKRKSEERVAKKRFRTRTITLLSEKEEREITIEKRHHIKLAKVTGGLEQKGWECPKKG